MRTLLIAALALGLGGPLAAAPAKHQPAGVIISLSGKVTLFLPAPKSPVKSAKPAEAIAKAPSLGQTIFAGDRLTTGANGRVGLVLTDGTQLKMNYDTDITLSDRNSKGHTSARGIAAVKIFLGDLWAKVTKKDSTLEFDTPAAVAAVKGTEPLFEVSADGTTCVQLRGGKVRLSNERSGAVTLDPDFQICLSKHQLITAALLQPWNGNSSTWEQGVGQASQAAVTVNYVDQGGVTRALLLNYAAGPATGTAQSKTPTPGTGSH